MAEDRKFWGKHLVLDCKFGDEQVKNPEAIRAFAKELVERIDMVPFGEPQVVHFADGVPHLSGWTLVQLIETSNIMAHFNDQDNSCYLDVFSCKDFDEQDVVDCAYEHFGFQDFNKTVLLRDVRFPGQVIG